MSLGDDRLKWITENFSYKVFALLVTLIVWFTVVGRRDLHVTRDVNLHYQIQSSLAMVNEPAHRAKVTILGSRRELKRFLANQAHFDVDLHHYGEGAHQVLLTERMLRPLPSARVMSIKPKSVTVVLKKPAAPIKSKTSGAESNIETTVKSLGD